MTIGGSRDLAGMDLNTLMYLMYMQKSKEELIEMKKELTNKDSKEVEHAKVLVK